MTKVKLELPGIFHFTVDIPIRISDLNYGGHLGNDAVLSIVHEARVKYLNSMGFSELDVDGNSIIMTDAVIIFKSEGFYGDIIHIQLAIGELSRVSCDFYYKLSNKATGKEIARIKTGIVFFDYKLRKVQDVPKLFIE